ncbi:MAG: universal stress protein [Deltaproteobacteria bacterium]|nr:universal stress protein [Deltaproteobacteria bacterium]
MMSGTMKITRILFATDLSPVADHAFKYAANFANALGVEVTVLHVLEKLRPNAELMLSALLNYDDPEALRAATQSNLMERVKDHISGLCRDAACSMPGCGFDAGRVIIEPGDPVHIILSHLDSGKFDLLIMGTMGYGVVEEFFIGSTAHKVLRKTRVPVLVVPERG